MSSDPRQGRKKAEALYAAGEWAEADRLFAALRAEGHTVVDGDLLHDHAVCIFQLGRRKEALQEFDRAVALEPNKAYRYASRAWVRAAMKDVDGAMADYRKALELDPEDVITLNNLGLLEEQYGMRKAAQERYRQADTLMGILKDAGVDPASDPPDAEEEVPESDREHRKAARWEMGPLLREMATVFSDRKRRREFIDFIRNGFRG